MAKMNTVWGIDIGQTALKALELREEDGQLYVESVDVAEHPQSLSQPDVDSRQVVREALEQFLSRHDVTGSKVCISVPGQSSFTRFVKLPPVEPKKIPDIVRFEAEQQIPFPINDVIWRWQTFHDPDSPDVEVGIFAMKRTDIDETLSHFTEAEMDVDIVQMAPLALYNFLKYDEQTAGDGATLLVDVGTDKTDLVVADGPRIWIRTIQIGGNSFTEALVKAFKLSHKKAEKLKRTAASSKYARQVFQAMRPVFADLVQEIQRSVGYYTSLHRDAKFTRMVGLGNGFRLPGLQKFLEQNLSLPIVRVDNYNKLQLAPTVNAAAFADNVLSLAVAYGTALQGLGEGEVATNLLPSQISRSRQWGKKRPWFAAAAALILLAVGTITFRSFGDRSDYVAGERDLKKARSTVQNIKRLRSQYSSAQSEVESLEKSIKSKRKPLEYRDYWTVLPELIYKGIDNRLRDQELIKKYVWAQSQEQKEQIRQQIKQIPRAKRVMLFTESIRVGYRPNAGQDSGARAGGSVKRGFVIYLVGRTPLPQDQAEVLLGKLHTEWKQLAEKEPRLTVLECKTEAFLRQGESGGGPVRRVTASRGGGGFKGGGGYKGGGGGYTRGDSSAKEEVVAAVAKIPDPLFPNDPEEDEARDTRFRVKVVVSIEDPAASAG